MREIYGLWTLQLAESISPIRAMYTVTCWRSFYHILHKINTVTNYFILQHFANEKLIKEFPIFNIPCLNPTLQHFNSSVTVLQAWEEGKLSFRMNTLK